MINILPTEEKKQIHREYWTRFASVILVMISILSIFATILVLPSYFFSESKEKLVENKLEIFNKDNPEIKVDNLNKITNDINSKLKTLNSKWSKSTDIYNVLNTVLSLKPEGIKITQFLYNENSDGSKIFEIHGQAVNRIILQNFKTTLEGNSNFSNVELPISNFVQKTEIDFTMSLILK